MSTDTKTLDDEKFFFDQHNFDDDHEEEPEELEPPPPVYSEAQLEAAKKKAYQDGHNAATLAEKESRAQHLNMVMDRVLAEVSVVFAHEDEREARYETEAVNLTRAVFETAFPYYAERVGFDEMLNALKTITDKYSKQDAVTVRINPDYVDGITTYLKKIEVKNPDIRFDVTGDANIKDTTCRLSWNKGGAAHDPGALAQEILAILDDGLAGRPTNSHDNEDTQSSEAPAQETQETIAEDAQTDDDNPDLKEQPDE